MAIPKATKGPEVKRGILVTTSYTPPRLSTIEWVEERRAVVIVTKQDGVDQSHMSEPSRRRPKHAIIPWDGSDQQLSAWQKKISDVANTYTLYTNYVERLSADVEADHMTYPSKEEAARKGGR